MTAKLAAKPWEARPGSWLVGLGCLAIPRAVLLELEERSEPFEFMGQIYRAFTWSGAEDGEWIAEDYRLSMNLGGIHLCPLGVGHIKKGSIWPDAETLKELSNGSPHALGATV
jgi:hypothetical protein